MSFADELFKLVHMVWYDLIAYDAASFFRDNDIVFDANATEVAVVVDCIVVDEVFVKSLAFPKVDEMRNEIDARFHCHYESFLYATAASQAIESKLL